jgi:hypothetical protein
MKASIIRLQSFLDTSGFDPGPHDGKFGPRTAHALWRAWKDGTNREDPAVVEARNMLCGTDGDRMIVGGELVPVPFWCRHWRWRHWGHEPRSREPVQVILHHDACPTVEGTMASFGPTKSTHFLVDDRGIVLQALDPAQDIAYHAKGFNRLSVGVDIHNPVERRFDGWWRPVVLKLIGGQTWNGWGLYDHQIEVAIELLRVLRQYIPTIGAEHKASPGYDSSITRATPGIWGHGQVQENKWPTEPHGFPFSRLKEVSDADRT